MCQWQGGGGGEELSPPLAVEFRCIGRIQCFVVKGIHVLWCQESSCAVHCISYQLYCHAAGV
jgi:hypothetical protein